MTGTGSSGLAGTGPGRGSVWAFLLLIPLVLGAPAQLQAQTGERGGEQELGREEMLARIHAQFERELETRLGLDAQGRAEVQEILASMRSERRRLYHRKRALERERKDFGSGGGSQAEARGILAEARAIRADEARIEAEEEARLLEILSPRQVLEFQILRDDFNERIREVFRRRGGGHSGSGGSQRR